MLLYLDPVYYQYLEMRQVVFFRWLGGCVTIALFSGIYHTYCRKRVQIRPEEHQRRKKEKMGNLGFNTVRLYLGPPAEYLLVCVLTEK